MSVLLDAGEARAPLVVPEKQTGFVLSLKKHWTFKGIVAPLVLAGLFYAKSGVKDIAQASSSSKEKNELVLIHAQGDTSKFIPSHVHDQNEEKKKNDKNKKHPYRARKKDLPQADTSEADKDPATCPKYRAFLKQHFFTHVNQAGTLVDGFPQPILSPAGQLRSYSQYLQGVYIQELSDHGISDRQYTQAAIFRELEEFIANRELIVDPDNFSRQDFLEIWEVIQELYPHESEKSDTLVLALLRNFPARAPSYTPAQTEKLTYDMAA